MEQGHWSLMEQRVWFVDLVTEVISLSVIVGDDNILGGECVTHLNLGVRFCLFVCKS